ncbi:apolipoprotein N-acyltransferase [Sphingomonas sp. BT-65]|uniref:apolipoprotein N-acyltransferase n=1 Tax=Sphingomonas sp. BT-65 TaxID=2989821 RepID=UPI0022356608|nr:apolipoprotein N-acyltransferase [Sphingomonas sp. BT-65]MCW4463394.1 apolipoprotein N-acyltransferase [Sphingomonas sp. BT-65]
MLPRPRLIALVAGATSATAFAPLDWWVVGLICFAILLRLTHEAPTLRQALLRGWLFGLGHFTVGNNWIQHAFDYQDKMPPALGYLAVVLLSLYLAVYPAIAMGLAWRFGRMGATLLRRPDLPFVLVAGAAWTVAEYLRGVMFTGYPWNPLGVIWLKLPGVAQIAAFTGTYALSGLTVVVAGTLYLASRRDWRPAAGVAVALLAIGLLLNPAVSPPAANAPLVRVLQPNVGQDATLDGTYAQKAMEALTRLSNDRVTILPGGPVPRLIVWPEGTVDYWIEEGYPPEWYGKGDPRTIRQMIAMTLGPKDMALVGGNALLFGGDRTLDAATNSVFAIDPTGAIRGRYDKAHLVPYGEYLPMRAILKPLGLSRLVMGDIDFRPGPGPQTLEVPGFGRIGMQICYEIIFSGETVDPANRPAILFNPSNDAWFGSWGPPQHLAQARMRAIEEGLPILRATPTGISAIIDARGLIVAAAGPGEAKAIEAPMPTALPPTLFARLGNWLAFIIAGLLLVVAIAIRRFAR